MGGKPKSRHNGGFVSQTASTFTAAATAVASRQDEGSRVAAGRGGEEWRGGIMVKRGKDGVGGLGMWGEGRASASGDREGGREWVGQGTPLRVSATRIHVEAEAPFSYADTDKNDVNSGLGGHGTAAVHGTAALQRPSNVPVSLQRAGSELQRASSIPTPSNYHASHFPENVYSWSKQVCCVYVSLCLCVLMACINVSLCV